MLKFFRLYGLSIVVMLFVLYMSIKTGSTPEFLNNMPKIEGVDKIVHFIFYLMITLALCRDLYRQYVSFNSFKMIGLAIIMPIVYGGVIELMQEAYFQPRTAEWGDWIADILGTFVAYFICKHYYPNLVKQN